MHINYDGNTFIKSISWDASKNSCDWIMWRDNWTKQRTDLKCYFNNSEISELKSVIKMFWYNHHIIMTVFPNIKQTSQFPFISNFGFQLKENSVFQLKLYWMGLNDVMRLNAAGAIVNLYC